MTFTCIDVNTYTLQMQGALQLSTNVIMENASVLLFGVIITMTVEISVMNSDVVIDVCQSIVVLTADMFFPCILSSPMLLLSAAM